MDLNGIFFPAPRDRYNCVTHFGEMIYLPKVIVKENGLDVAKIDVKEKNEAIYIPCLLIQHKLIR